MSMGGAVVGALAGVAILAMIGAGAKGLPSALVGIVVGSIVGALVALLSSWYALGLAARPRWLRARLQTFWVAYILTTSALTAAFIAVVILRL